MGNLMSAFFYIVVLLFSINTPAKVNSDSFNYEFTCDDLQKGRMIYDSKIGSYPEYEMDDGYSGIIDFKLVNDEIKIYHQGLLVSLIDIKSDSVEVNGEQFTVIASSSKYFTFAFMNELSNIEYINFENEGNEEKIFTCKNPNAKDETERLINYIKIIKSNNMEVVK
ncbi:hypothetical protein L6J37_19335 [Photobacterium sp. WH77]|uniref:hypothetical protein n=1 Tax=unclassified Photobacterium TaxID=2628852 RepID=UPI001EDBBB34|nr:MULTISPECIES: hypothetical protein [unclassified Photobacterium]MCG2838990.1 hypothetical protein [Photobacterium sp. WH77]MCG2846607.1 hypothetical protein [Photobacterium sp. WH80]